MSAVLRLAGRLALACVFLLPAVAHADPDPQDDTASLVARFDRAVASGLPFSITLPATTASKPAPGRTRRAVQEGIVVERRLPVDLRLPAAVVAVMYAGRLNGEKAVFTRGGDRLDISVPSRAGVDVVVFRSGWDKVEWHNYPAGVGYVDEPEIRFQGELSIPPDHIEDPLAYHPTFHVFLHDDLGSGGDPADLHARLGAWWLEDLMTVLPGESQISLRYHSRIAWITDMDYEHVDVLDRFARALKLVAPALGLPYGRSYKHKFLLLTARPAIGRASGLALQGQSEATASIQGRLSVMAHEFGHTLGATHAAAVTGRYPTYPWSLLNWYQCDSNMHPSAPSTFSCLAYSADNERAIRSYLRHGPTSERPELWLERR
ncbi:hypothetical protein [Xanthomonas sp. NCPPB 2632]|jgi:hypothetical protein|uniref:hypothetical protein n=1 Tax=Xanthomonas sp. NCPPB 2632 TaxID=3240912 RepID=UPI003517862D